MTKPKILVTSAAGHTGSIVAMQLLEKGYPVRAFVRREDKRSEKLKSAGAEIIAGDLTDIRDLRKALQGVSRAYYCPPFSENILHSSMLFSQASEEASLEVLVVLTAWNPHPTHPSIHQREHWLSNNVLKWMPTVDVIYLNPGLFAFPYFFGISAAAHLGKLLLPFGEGLNAPPSNEDIATVAACILDNPSPHIGKSYRPTGPRLISGHEVAGTFSTILDRKVVYQDVPISMFLKAARVLGFSNFEMSQIRHYAEEVKGGTYALSAPTNHVELVTGIPAEEFEVTARRYIENPELVFSGLKIGGRMEALRFMLKMILTPVPDLDKWESTRGYPLIEKGLLAHDSEEWLRTARNEQLSLNNTNKEVIASDAPKLAV